MAHTAQPENQQHPHALRHLLRRYFLLFCIISGLVSSMLLPGLGQFMGRLGLGSVLIAGIFLVQGMDMDLSGFTDLKGFIPTIAMGAVVALVLYPVAGALGADLFGLSSDYRIGLILMASLPTTLAAAIPMTVGAGGDRLTSLMLVVSLNILGLASVPLNIDGWLGAHTSVSGLSVLKSLLGFLFIPMFLGQLVKRRAPGLAAKTAASARFFPEISLGVLVFMSCAKESALLREMTLSDIAHLLAPCLLVHLSLLGIAWFSASRVLRLPGPRIRSFALICSEKPMTLSVAIWSLNFSHAHPMSIFPLLMFYVAQMVTDSLAASVMAKNR